MTAEATMTTSCRQLVAAARLAFCVALRSRAFLACALLAALFSVLETVPVSPGLVAGKLHHLETGVSTLLLGGVILSLVVWPRVFPSISAGRSAEAVLALPVRPELLALGSFSGFGAALGIYFLAAGGALAAAAALFFQDAELGRLTAAAAAAFLLSMITAAAAAALLSAITTPLPALLAGVLLVLAGQATAWWPAPVAAFLPPFDVLDPARVLREGAAALWAPAVRGIACLGLYLCVAAGLKALWQRGPLDRARRAGTCEMDGSRRGPQGSGHPLPKSR